jgi:hypothetical protein
MSHYDYLSPHMAGLAGPVEDLASVAVKSVAEHVGKNREAAWNYFRFGVADISASAAEGRIKGWTNLTPAFKAAMDALKFSMFPPILTALKDSKLEDRLRLQAVLKSKFDAEWAKAFPSSAALTKAEAVEKAKEAARAQIEAKISDMRQRGIADAKVGKYAAPAPTAPPDFDTMNYQAGWLSTGAALPPGVVPVGEGGIPEESGGGAGAGGAGGASGAGGAGGAGSKFPVVPVAIGAAALAALLLLKRK